MLLHPHPRKGTDFYPFPPAVPCWPLPIKDIVNHADDGAEPIFAVQVCGAEGLQQRRDRLYRRRPDYTLDEDGNILPAARIVGYISRFVVRPRSRTASAITRDFKEELEAAIDDDVSEFVYHGRGR